MPGRHQTPHRRATELHTSSVNSTAATELHYQSATELHILGRLWPNPWQSGGALGVTQSNIVESSGALGKLRRSPWRLVADLRRGHGVWWLSRLGDRRP